MAIDVIIGDVIEDENSNGGANSLSELNDVDLTGAQVGNVLKLAPTGKWSPATDVSSTPGIFVTIPSNEVGGTIHVDANLKGLTMLYRRAVGFMVKGTADNPAEWMQNPDGGFILQTAGDTIYVDDEFTAFK